VNVALEHERKEMIRLKQENESLHRKNEALLSDNSSLQADKKHLQGSIEELKEDLSLYTRTADAKESIRKIESLRR